MDSTGVKEELNRSAVSEDLFPDIPTDPEEDDKPLKADPEEKKKPGKESEDEQDPPKAIQKKDEADDEDEQEKLTDYSEGEQSPPPKVKPTVSKPVTKPKPKRVHKPKMDLDEGLVGPLDSSVAEQVKATGGRRERKQVQHFAQATSEKKAFTIEAGTGTKLADIPYIAEQISDKKRKAEDFRILHKICFDRPGTKNDIKKNIRQFSGFSFVAHSDEYKRKRERMIKYKASELKVACSVLGVKQNTVDKMVDEILEFCVQPEDTGRKPKQSTTTPKSRSKQHSPKTPKGKATSAKGKKNKRSSSDVDEESEEDAPPPKKRSRVREGSTRTSSAGKKYADVDHSEEEMEADEVSSTPATIATSDEEPMESEEEKPVEPKRVTPKTKSKVSVKPKSSKASNGTKVTAPKGKAAASKSKPVAKGKNKETSGSEDEEAETRESDEEEEHKGGATISDKELTTTIKKIVKASDLRHVTMKMILDKIFEAYPDADLEKRRVSIKSIVRKMI